ncbi:hypothetical protein [Streptomyces bobili]|uniref:hypothetical protein n=1 Tax=Streptomyces bobili TaxID=67280 RepID=UPI003715F3A8
MRTSIGAIIAARLRAAQAYPPPATARHDAAPLDEPFAQTTTQRSSTAAADRSVHQDLAYRALVECAGCGVPATAPGRGPVPGLPGLAAVPHLPRPHPQARPPRQRRPLHDVHRHPGRPVHRGPSPRREPPPLNSFWPCGCCGTGNADRASCAACGTSSPTATPAALAATALRDAAAARAAQRQEAARGNHRLAADLGAVMDAHLDDALALRRPTPHETPPTHTYAQPDEQGSALPHCR